MDNNNAHNQGFQDGYNAALNDKPKKTSPSLAGTLALSGYLPRYLHGYKSGYAKGQSDRSLLLQGREQTEEWYLQNHVSHERTDV